jgi:UDP-N-acetylglucosamine:LPS N-acetylglucosamine transferase
MARTILILTSKTGGGHISLAESLRDRLLASPAYRSARIELLDPQSRFFHWHYRMVSRYALWLWAGEFHLIDAPRRAQLAHHIFTSTVARSLGEAIRQLGPQLIITTYPFLTYEVVEVLRRLKLDIPFVMLFTDPNGVHASWLTEKRAAATLAPTRETYEQALAAGFASSRLHQVGWPVRAQFSQGGTDHEPRAAMLKRLDLDPASEKFTVFLQGGGEGAAQFGRTIERVVAIDENIQVILATGTNRALLERFSNVKRLHALPFTKEIAPYVAAADIVMGKAGPNMLFETVTLGKPFVATSYIPGQEQANLEFIRRHKLGWVALDADQQVELLRRLRANPKEVEAMTEMVARYRAWNVEGVERIVPIIEGVLEGR